MFYAHTRRQRSWRGVVVALASAAMVGVPALALAQAPQDQPPPAAAPQSAPQDTIKSADVTDMELEQFAKSVEDVVEIQEETEKRLESMNDSAEVQKVKTEANERMAEAIQGHGLQVERFNLIARSVNQDPELKQRLQEKMQELRQPA